MKELKPLYELLATIVHMDYTNAVTAIKEIIPGQISAGINLFETTSSIEPDKKEELKKGLMWYMYESRRFFEEFNQRGDYSEVDYLPILIHRFQVDAERTRIYLELWERDTEATVDFLALDF